MWCASTSPTATPRTTSAAPSQIREAASLAGRPVGILADMQGPKIRVGKFEEGRVTLDQDDALHPRRRDASSATPAGSASTTRICPAT